MQFVAQNLGIGLAPQWIKKISPGGLAFIPFMPGDAYLDMYIAYRKNGNSPTANGFIHASKEIASQITEPNK